MRSFSRIEFYARHIDSTSEALPLAKTKIERDIHRFNLKNWAEAILLEVEAIKEQAWDKNTGEKP